MRENRLGCLEHYLASALRKARARLGNKGPDMFWGLCFLSLPCLEKLTAASNLPGRAFILLEAILGRTKAHERINGENPARL